MSIVSEKFTVNTKGFTDLIDITEKIKVIIDNKNIKDANLMVYVKGSTASIVTLEFEPGLLKDLPIMYEKIIPSNREYNHDITWKDGNGYAHLRASLSGNSIFVPIINHNLELGTWQQIVLIDFDNKPRVREIVLQFLY